MPVFLAPLLSREKVAGKYHPRTRDAYRPSELGALQKRLTRAGAGPAGVTVRIDPDARPWQALDAIAAIRPERPGSLSLLCDLSKCDERGLLNRVAEAAFAAARLPDCRLFFDPLVDLDRTNDTSLGLLDLCGKPHRAIQPRVC